MKINELLSEAPLPDDWDKSTYKSNTSFASRLRYAKERAAKIGTGSSRVAFEIEYEGRPTILKIAKNKKGIAQNEYEAEMLESYYVKDLGITIPMIDYDEENTPPTWIHLEKAEKMRLPIFRKFFNGMSPDQLVEMAKYMAGKWGIKVSPEDEEKFNEIYENNEAVNSLVDLIGNFDIPPGDFAAINNWGVYKGHPVIIDIGFSESVQKLHYS